MMILLNALTTAAIGKSDFFDKNYKAPSMSWESVFIIIYVSDKIYSGRWTWTLSIVHKNPIHLKLSEKIVDCSNHRVVKLKWFPTHQMKPTTIWCELNTAFNSQNLSLFTFRQNDTWHVPLNSLIHTVIIFVLLIAFKRSLKTTFKLQNSECVVIKGPKRLNLFQNAE